MAAIFKICALCQTKEIYGCKLVITKNSSKKIINKSKFPSNAKHKWILHGFLVFHFENWLVFFYHYFIINDLVLYSYLFVIYDSWKLDECMHSWCDLRRWYFMDLEAFLLLIWLCRLITSWCLLILLSSNPSCCILFSCLRLTLTEIFLFSFIKLGVFFWFS